MNKNKTIALLVCYFGKLPWYFEYFVHSCKYNPSVDFYIITDDKTYANTLPANVKLIYKTLPEVRQTASKKLGFDTHIPNGYKLCDFKPAFGFIFFELIRNYAFWGFCDIDVIFGNIRDFMTDELLENYDLVSTRPDWIPGCFLLFKNNFKMNTLFMKSKDYKKVFTNEKHYCFDETNFAHHAFEAGRSYLEIDTEIESMMHVVKKMEEENYIKPFFDLYIIEGGCPGRLRWEDGKLTYRNKFEVLLYHLIRFKGHYIPKRKINCIPGSFTISPTKIYHKQVPKTILNGF
jgi:hypothetical protein